MSAASEPVTRQPEGLRETLEAAKDYIDGLSAQPGYGFYRPANPHDFTPDAESCSEEEIAAHRAACEAFDKGEYTPERGSDWGVGPAHILRAPWGIGSYVSRCGRAEQIMARIDLHLDALNSSDETPQAEVQS